MAQIKERADELVFLQGLAESREKAKRLIMAGHIALASDTESAKLETNAVTKAALSASKESGIIQSHTEKSSHPPVKVDKPGHKFPAETRFMLVGIEPFVSRGAYKLLTALHFFQMNVENLICLDAGASTGGFTDCLLQHGAARVYAVDVGKAQLHERLRTDARVISREGINLRCPPPDLIPEKIDLLVLDLSFISLRLVLPSCMQWLKADAQIIALIKPQFELGPGQTDKGVVHDPELRQKAVSDIIQFCQTDLNLQCAGFVPSSLKGPKGNQEYLALFSPRQDAV